MNEFSGPISEKIAFIGKIGEVIHTEQKSGKVFERYRRSPGVRLVIISSENKILVSKEYRAEVGGYDIRLPGGKVADTVENFHKILDSGQDITEAAEDAAKKEALEETGLIIKEMELITVANAGATVEWDLYYFLVHNFEISDAGQQLEHGEDIETSWMDVGELYKAMQDGLMQEWRSVGVLSVLVLPKLVEK